MHSGLTPGQKVPSLIAALVGEGSYDLYQERPKSFSMVVVYRGLHCKLCKQQLSALASKLSDFEALGVEVIAISMDTAARAREAAETWETGDLRIGYNLSPADANLWGLFISEGEKEGEPLYFAEPAIFLVCPDGTLFAQFLQTVPFARPHWDDLLEGIAFVQEHDTPIRGKISTNMEALSEKLKPPPVASS